MRKLDPEKVPVHREPFKTAEDLRLSDPILLWNGDLEQPISMVYVAFASNDDDAAGAEVELEERWLEADAFHESVDLLYSHLAAARSRNAVYWASTNEWVPEKVQGRVQKCLKR